MTSLQGEIDDRIFYYSENPERMLYWKTPPQLKELHFSLDTNIKSGVYPVPGLIWKLEGEKMSMYAYKEFKGLKTELFRAPFYNVNGAVCFGGASSIIRANRNTTFSGFIEYIETVFWESKFTHGGAVVQNFNYPALMDHLLENSILEFPLDALKPITNNFDDDEEN